MRNIILAAFAAITLTACGTTSGMNPANVEHELVCKNGTSVNNVLKEDQAQVAVAAPELDISVAKVVTGEKAIAFAKENGVDADTIVILIATDRNTKERTVKSHVLALKDGCVVGHKFEYNEKLDKIFQ